MGTKVMVRATRSFNGRVENEWYYVDPDDEHIRALITGGYFAHQETLPIETPLPEPTLTTAVAAAKRRVRRGQVEAEPGSHHPDSAG